MRRPTLTKQLLTLAVKFEAAERLKTLAKTQGSSPSEFLEKLLSPVIEAENASELRWVLIALNESDHARLKTFCRRQKRSLEEFIDETVGDAIERLGHE